MGLSGKCDFQDTVELYGADKILNNYKIYAAHNDVIPLKFEKQADLIAYYPYLVAMMYGDNKNGCGIIQLSERSFIDSEEEEWLSWRMNEVKRIWRKCKRNKEPFTREITKENLGAWCVEPDGYKKEIIDRVEKFGDKATIEGIHDPMHDKIRKEWYELMVNSGWDKQTAYRWVYGWKRYLTRVDETERDLSEDGN